MSQQKELEIKRQFLEEAQDYLGTLESAVLGLAHRQIDLEKINAALRAAHSIKGGAGMMGFGVLSQLAHRLEDSFKVLKIQKNSLTCDAELERLLLAAVDCLRMAIAGDRDSLLGGDIWGANAEPTGVATGSEIFDQLHQRLGDPAAEDAVSVLSPEEGQDVIPLLFETEVEGCLQRLESVLADPQMPCLQEELEILAQELGGLGEMLALTTFSQLCESVIEQLAQTSGRTEEIARLALEAWRQSQALVLTGQFDLLPKAISLSDANAISLSDAKAIATNPQQQAEDTQSVFATDISPFDLVPEEMAVADWNYGEELENLFSSSPDSQDQSFDFLTTYTEPPLTPSSDSESQDQSFDFLTTYTELPLTPSSDEQSSSFWEIAPTELNNGGTLPHFSSQFGEEPVSSVPFDDTTEPKLEIESDRQTIPPTGEDPDVTVRVPVKYLTLLNDLFGELTIERNSLSLQLKNLHSLVSILSRRLSTLERVGSQLEFSYDKIATLGASNGKQEEAENSWRDALLGKSAEKIRIPRLLPGNEPNSRQEPSSRIPRLLPGNEPNSRLDITFDVLEMDRYDNLHLLGREVMETIVRIQEVAGDIELDLEETQQTARNLNKTAKQMQTNLNCIRMRPLADILARFPVALRELSLHNGKPVDLKIYGQQTLVDRNILEALHDPLMHLLRNAFDHGIEDPETRKQRGKPKQGLIEIRASHRGSRTVIVVKDDGGGIAIEKIRHKAIAMGLDAELLSTASDRDLLSLIFEPGFTTKQEVTNLSGRGVGMDVVRNNLKQIRGEIQVDTQPFVGTTFTITVPYTLSVTRVLIAQSDRMLLAFPVDAIEQIIPLEPEQVRETGGREVLKLEQKIVPLLRPERWLKFQSSPQFNKLNTPAAIARPTALIVSGGDGPVGIVINSCWSEQEVTIRHVEGDLPLPPGFSSCAILGNGRVVPLVDVPEFVRWVGSSDRVASLPSNRYTQQALIALPDEDNTILIVDDSVNVRRFLALTLEKAGYRVEQAKDGQDALDKLQAGLSVSAAICDIEMPYLDGYGFLAQVKNNTDFQNMPVIMLTSRTGDKHRNLAMNLGASAYFSKPYNEQTLLQTLETLTR